MLKNLLLGVIASVVVAVGPAWAHHGTSITYQAEKSITVSGVVTEFVYGYPHPQVYFDVTDEAGKVQHWGSEFGPTPLMMRNLNIGWARDWIKAGDKITIICSPHRTPGATACLAREIQINGKLVPLNGEQVKRAAAATAAR